MKLSIVTTLYHSAPYVEEFYSRTSNVGRTLASEDYEIIFVNDGSPDNSLDIAVQLSEIDGHVVVIDLSRNFGHHKAMMAGLKNASGDLIFLIDSDLEEEPEWLLKFSDQMQHENCDVVYGVQAKRKGGWFERWSGELYYVLLDIILHMKHPRNITTARLMSKRYVDALLFHKESEIVISGLWLITGFEQNSQFVIKSSKRKTSYNLFHKFSYLVNVVTSFSSKPLIFIFFTGLVIFILSILYSAYLVFNIILFARPIDGWTSLIVSIWTLGGLNILFIGIVGIYLSKVFLEVKQRPNYIVKEIYFGKKH
jgi:putative glycosyltransferase